MRHLFSHEGERALDAVMQLEPLLAFDFDGTLAPIVPMPHEARVPKAVSDGLDRLSRRLPLAIITGRSVTDVKPRLGFEPNYIVGNHGAEDPLIGPPSSASQALDAVRERIDVHAEALRRAGIVALLYAFFLETVAGNMPGLMKRLSVSFYMRCLMFDSGSDYGIGPERPWIYQPVSGTTSAWVLAGATLALLLAGMVVFSAANISMSNEGRSRGRAG